MLLDDFDFPGLAHLLKIWADKYACYGEVKGGTVPLMHSHIVITSNYTPDQLWADKVRPDGSIIEDNGILLQALLRRFVVILKLNRNHIPHIPFSNIPEIPSDYSDDDSDEEVD